MATSPSLSFLNHRDVKDQHVAGGTVVGIRYYVSSRRSAQDQASDFKGTLSQYLPCSESYWCFISRSPNNSPYAREFATVYINNAAAVRPLPNSSSLEKHYLSAGAVNGVRLPIRRPESPEFKTSSKWPPGSLRIMSQTTQYCRPGLMQNVLPPR